MPNQTNHLEPDGSAVVPGINIWSGAKGLGGALTNMSELARKKGCIVNEYPVVINGVRYPDSEAAYQALKYPGHAAYNDGLMIDILALKLTQNPRLQNLITRNGGLSWLGRCSHFTHAKTARFASWEGQGANSRFITNLMHGYQKALSGTGPVTRVVSVREAPFDVYIGREMPDFVGSPWQNPHRSGDLLEKVTLFHADLLQNPELLAKLPSLRGKTLGCWCKKRHDPHALCHGDVLAAMADFGHWEPPVPAQGSLF